MTSIPDSVKATLDAGWSGAGGAEPTYYVSEDFRTDPPLGKDGIWIPTSTLKTKIEPVNDTYANKMHTLDIIVNTQTDEDRLKEIADEVERILNATAITGATYQKVIDRKSNVGQYNGIWVYQEIITVDIREHMASSASSYGAGSVTLLDSLMMYGSANAAFIPGVFSGEYPADGLIKVVGGIYTIGAGPATIYASFVIPLPCAKGSLKLYIDNIIIGITDADASNYLTQIYLYGISADTSTSVYTSGTNRTSAGTYTYDTSDADMSSYAAAEIWLRIESDTSGSDFDFYKIGATCYYDT